MLTWNSNDNALRSEGRRNTQLRKTQKLWLAYRDANCEAQFRLITPNPGADTAELECLVRLTRERTAALRRLYGTASDK